MASLYLHIPFCERKCLYCDFYSLEGTALMEQFLGALRHEIDLSSPTGEGVEFDTLFLGGGTPSLLTPAQLESLLRHVRVRFRLADDAEVTLETNPGTVTADSLRGYRACGVNRLSIGIQSLDPSELEFLTRIHDPGQALRCIRDARAAGFENFSVDVIYALPGQTPGRWLETMQRVIALEPPHVSAYGLIVEEGTPLARMVNANLVRPAPVEAEAELYELTMELLDRAGYEHYEVSSYARPGYRCKHNLAYWSRAPYLGFGPSAHSFWPDGKEGGMHGCRWWNIRNLDRYIGMIGEGVLPRAGSEQLSDRDVLTERVFLGLRSGGLDLAEVGKDLGRDLAREQHLLLAALQEEGLILREDPRIRLSPRGFLLCDEVCRRLLSLS